MKYKTYKWVLELFLILFFTVLSVFCIFNLKDNLSRVKESYLREYNFLLNSMTKDILVMESSDYNTDMAMQICYKDYGKRYNSQGIYLEVYKESKCLYSTMPEENAIDISKMSKDKKNLQTKIITIDKSKYIRIFGYLPDKYSDYSIVFYTDVTETINKWVKNIFSLLIGGIIFSCVLSICLMLLLDYLFRPLEKISEASKKIAQGDYKGRLEISGEGEIKEVVTSFNIMADTINQQIQKLEDNATEKQMLIDNLAHELRTPLTAIYGYAEYMQKTQLKEEDKYVSTQFILHETKRLKAISEMLLNLAALREETTLEMKTIPMEELLKRIHHMENIKLRERNIQFHYNNEIDTIYGNEVLIESMLINIIDNAIKACEKEKSSITVHTYMKENSKIIEISDNGKGMTKEQVSHVTEAFYRVDKSRSRDEGGNGLGLALCDEIAKKHDAKLVIDSIVGEGTKVSIIMKE